MTDTADIKLARRLAILVAEKGQSAVPEIRPALDKLLADRSNSEKNRFLKAFLHYLKREIHKDTLIIETAGSPEPAVIDSLTQTFSKDRQRPLHVETRQQPDLIAGVRVRLGDNVYDASIQGKLAALANSIH